MKLSCKSQENDETELKSQENNETELQKSGE